MKCAKQFYDHCHKSPLLSLLLLLLILLVVWKRTIEEMQEETRLVETAVRARGCARAPWRRCTGRWGWGPSSGSPHHSLSNRSRTAPCLACWDEATSRLVPPPVRLSEAVETIPFDGERKVPEVGGGTARLVGPQPPDRRESQRLMGGGIPPWIWLTGRQSIGHNIHWWASVINLSEGKKLPKGGAVLPDATLSAFGDYMLPGSAKGGGLSGGMSSKNCCWLADCGLDPNLPTGEKLLVATWLLVGPLPPEEGALRLGKSSVPTPSRSCPNS